MLLSFKKGLKWFCFFLLILNNFETFGQCEDYLGYGRNGLLQSTKSLKGHLSVQDTAMKFFFIGSLAKTEATNGIIMLGFFFGNVGTIDKTTKVKITFNDNSYITLTDYLANTNHDVPPSTSNQKFTVNYFNALVTDKYSLLLLKTKPISKVQITGSQIDAATYLVDGMNSIDFLLGMECLQNYL
jgi:hypothetical protein